MKLIPTDLPAAWIIEPEPVRDERGFFARTVCTRELEDRGLVGTFVQCSLSKSLRRGTVRGLHFQKPPATEVKIVRCVAGAIHDVVVDVRPDSPAFGRHIAVELSADNLRSLYVPPGFAHGFQTLTDDATVHYHISAFFSPESAAGVRWDDPDLDIRWPLPLAVISAKDRSLPRLHERQDLDCLKGLRR